MAKSKKKARVAGGATPYRKGADFEREVAQWYMDQGCLVVRQPKSQSPFDLIVVRPLSVLSGPSHYVALVQCKLGGYISPKERSELDEVALKFGAVPILATKKEGGITIEVIASEDWT